MPGVGTILQKTSRYIITLQILQRITSHRMKIDTSVKLLKNLLYTFQHNWEYNCVM